MKLLFTLCLLDIVWTVFVVQTGRAVERNPIMATAYAHGVLAFILVKLLSFAVPLYLVSRLRKHNPKAIANALLGTGYHVLDREDEVPESELARRFRIVLDLASQNTIDTREWEMREQREEQEEAIQTVKEHAEEFLGVSLP